MPIGGRGGGSKKTSSGLFGWLFVWGRWYFIHANEVCQGEERNAKAWTGKKRIYKGMIGLSLRQEVREAERLY